MAVLVPNVLFGNHLKHTLFKENKPQMNKGINRLFAGTLYCTFKEVKSEKIFINA